MSRLSSVQLSLSLKCPENLSGIITGQKWFESRRESDGAEGLWRIHDGLYDVSEFVGFHPGGESWLVMTKGTDITEAFEAHHILAFPEQLLQQYYVRKALTPRNYPFTFEEDGFYRTLKRNIRPVLKNIPKNTVKTTDLVMDTLVIATFLSAILAIRFWNFSFAAISGCLLTLTVIAAHNYIHKRDNFRMYYFNLCLMDFRVWRISHSLSHHLLPNTIYDLEMITCIALVPHFPMKKSLIFKCRAFVSVILFCLVYYFIAYILKVLTVAKTKKMYLSDLVPFILPLVMYLSSGENLQHVLTMWLFLLTTSSFIFAVIGINSSHHHPDAFHEGDAPRSNKMDWGVHQLDTTYDRREIIGNSFLVLTTFGDHTLHHLFPTLDHGALCYLYPVFKKTMDEFGLDHQVRSQGEMMVGQFQQLARENPHQFPLESR